ncbi:hypothetical protein BAUCODRAFT_379117 [Baudoinia panamericana UAMH 10762]|uniref:Uncharacterized protein n=1 Tax=Baudoinia panamericana (strain UAMH 10762) TaxID=717646 RepID=M2NI17_BAUPA|nr:uncharacterized protein BAUCODRAFT_379117 [Baudoinia panamericana UAMH 10762]EMC98730.1 hypothetical protein BAUCODRAFT_379117 [Baudoinia panamericana UAMH 10762]
MPGRRRKAQNSESYGGSQRRKTQNDHPEEQLKDSQDKLREAQDQRNDRQRRIDRLSGEVNGLCGQLTIREARIARMTEQANERRSHTANLNCYCPCEDCLDDEDEKAGNCRSATPVSKSSTPNSEASDLKPLRFQHSMVDTRGKRDELSGEGTASSSRDAILGFADSTPSKDGNHDDDTFYHADVDDFDVEDSDEETNHELRTMFGKYCVKGTNVHAETMAATALQSPTAEAEGYVMVNPEDVDVMERQRERRAKAKGWLWRFDLDRGKML